MGDTSDMTAPFLRRIAVWRDTVALLPSWPAPPSTKVRYDPEAFPVDVAESLDNVSVEPLDTLDAALALVRAGRRPLVLNLADDSFPGGCVYTGSGAQEESLFRRTNLANALPLSLYPIRADQAILSRGVVVLKKSERQDHAPCEPFRVDVVSCPALRHPQLEEGRLTAADRGVLARKVELVCRVALAAGNDSMVLGAMGCGAWRNPPRDVAEVMAAVLRRYAPRLERVVIAVLPDAEYGYTTRLPVSREDNYTAFADVFRGQV
jgi:uncharacterized protein (TIGR02452 family)